MDDREFEAVEATRTEIAEGLCRQLASVVSKMCGYIGATGTIGTLEIAKANVIHQLCGDGAGDGDVD